MADQIFNVDCGFFDSINNDRTYSADDMNRPYKRLISNGVFATPQGTPSTDLQVMSAANAMDITINPGAGIFGNKWFENPAAITVTVPANTNIIPRIDSVIVQVDLRSSGRAGNIIYRTGTPSSTPTAPAINQVQNVNEYRVANIYVAPSANAINNDAITDMRGSSSCPWVQALINQPDTSTLFLQWQTAYNNFYTQSTQDYQTYVAQQRQAWEDFLADLTDDLTVSTNVIMLTSTYTTSGSSTTTIPINIASYNKDTDVLFVYINGLLAQPSVKYTVNSAGTQITLVNALGANQNVSFIVLHSVIAADIQSTVSMIQALDTKVSGFMQDSGWINFTLESGATAYDSNSTPGVRCIGDRVYLRGAFKGVTTLGKTICTLPIAYRPAQNHYFTTTAMSGTTIQDTITIQVMTTGLIKLYASSGSISSSAMIPMCTNFAVN